MNNSHWLCVGQIIKPHHLRGEVFLYLFAQTADWFKKQSKIEIGLSSNSQSHVPEAYYYLIDLKPHKNGFLCQLESIVNRTQADCLRKKYFFIPTSILTSSCSEEPFLYELLNFKVFNENQFIGYIVDFGWNQAQDILIIASSPSNSKTSDPLYFVPFVKEFIIECNYQAKTLYLQLPPGLLEINTP